MMGGEGGGSIGTSLFPMAKTACINLPWFGLYAYAWKEDMVVSTALPSLPSMHARRKQTTGLTHC